MQLDSFGTLDLECVMMMNDSASNASCPPGKKSASMLSIIESFSHKEDEDFGHEDKGLDEEEIPL